MDRIVLTGMRFYGYHGILPEETRLGQPFSVDLELSADLQAAGRTDDLALTIDYSKVYEGVREIVEGRPLKLIEAVAERIAMYVLEDFPAAEVVVRLHKPKAPIAGPFDDVMVELHRRRLP